MHDNIRRLVTIAEGLGTLREEMVFVGGTVTSLYADDQAEFKNMAPSKTDSPTRVNGMRKMEKNM